MLRRSPPGDPHELSNKGDVGFVLDNGDYNGNADKDDNQAAHG